MKTFKDNFTTPSVQEWLDKAEKDLKGKSLATLSWDWGNDMIFSPVNFNTPDAQNLTFSPSPTPWVIGERFVIQDLKSNNQAILVALDQGAEGIHLDIQHTLSTSDWATLLDKVMLQYIHTVISFSKEHSDSISHLASYIKDNSIDWKEDKLLLCCDSIWETTGLFSNCQQYASTIKVDTGRPATHLSKQLSSAETLLRQILDAKHAPTQHIFKVELHQSFYHNIITIQALRILWQNILDANQQDPHTPIFILAYTNNDSATDENTQKINATAQAISAVVAGADYFEVNTSDDSDFNRRINRNIQHLLKLESFMDFVMNPTEGSYYFDHLTKELVQATWTQFQKLDAA